MELSGNVVAILPAQTGEGQKGPWIKFGFVIETPGQYPKKIAFSMFAHDPNSKLSFQVGDNITVSFSIESREYNGRWYSDIKAYKITTESQRGAQSPRQSTPPPTEEDDLWKTPSPKQQAETNTDDLPF